MHSTVWFRTLFLWFANVIAEILDSFKGTRRKQFQFGSSEGLPADAGSII
jgi:hypothetical protein